MNKLIEKQLDKLQIAKLGPYDPIKKEYIIPKYNPVQLELNQSYILKFKDYMINPPPHSALMINWNNNTHPISSYVKAVVIKKIGMMIKIETCGYDIDTKKELENLWCGWIRKEDVDIISNV